MPDLIYKPLNKELNALNTLEIQRFETLQKEILTAIRAKLGKSIKKSVWKEMDIVKDRLSYCGDKLDMGDVHIRELQKARILELKRRYFEDYCSNNQYAVSIKEDTVYPCLHSPKTQRKQEQYVVSRKDQYAVSIKEDTVYPCLHSPKTQRKQEQYVVSRKDQYAVLKI
ncbi:hypothetical protein Tco_1178279 [Tanacetum coccineum]